MPGVLRCSAPADPQAVSERLEELRARRHEAQPQGIRTFGSTFKNPDDPRAEGAQRRAAARGGRLRRAGRRRRALLAEARELHREHRRGEHGRCARADGRGPADGRRALRRRARGRGADARRRAASAGGEGFRAPRSKMLEMDRTLAGRAGAVAPALAVHQRAAAGAAARVAAPRPAAARPRLPRPRRRLAARLLAIAAGFASC